MSRHGSIDWLCLPHFDNEAFFARLLGDTGNGFCAITPIENYKTERAYLPQTNILRTVFFTPHGQAELLDYMPIPAENSDDCHSGVTRIFRVIEGRMKITAHFSPRAEYGKTPPDAIEVDGDSYVFHWSRRRIRLITNRKPAMEEGAASWSLKLDRGEEFQLLFYYEVNRCTSDHHADLKRTESYWKNWCADFRYEGPHRDLVQRSALVLKALTYEPEGSLVAAPTTSLPEIIGGEWNWDYRYAWLRDSVFVIEALSKIGHKTEAAAFFKWLVRASDHLKAPISVGYNILGQKIAGEFFINHLEGYHGSCPVRIGNAAFQQFQLDVYGELIRALNRYLLEIEKNGDLPNKALANLLDWLKPRVYKADHGIWEIRGHAKNYVYSKAMAFMAYKSGIDAIETLGHTIKPEWRRTAARLRMEILEKGIDRERRCFIESYESKSLDAANLRLSLVGFIDPCDPIMVNTVEQTMRRLLHNGLVYRRETFDDKPGENAFLFCGFWLVENLILQGRRSEAEEIFKKLISYGNDLGLFSEEADPKTGELVGNFPQAFTHIGLINASLALSGEDHSRPSARKEQRKIKG